MQIKRTKIKPEKPNATRRKASLAGEARSARAWSPLEESVLNVPAGPAKTRGGKTTLLNYSTTTDIVNRCGVEPQSD